MVNFVEIVGITSLFLALAILLVTVFFFIFKCFAKATLFSCSLMIVFLNFYIIWYFARKISEQIQPRHLIIALIVLLIGLFILLLKKIKKNDVQIINFILMIIFGCLILVNYILASPTIYKKITFNRSEHEYLNTDTATNAGIYPNIYLLIFDEFSSFQAINRYHDYDNVILRDFFERNNINYSNSSNNRYWHTQHALADILNPQEELNVNHDYIEMEHLIKNPYIYSFLIDYGYAINTASVYNLIGQNQSTYMYADTMHNYYEDIRTIILNNTILYKFSFRILQSLDSFFKGTHILYEFDSDSYTLDFHTAIIDQFKYIRESSKLRESNLFTFSHLMYPHSPFLFDRSSNPRPEEDHFNWMDKNIYLEQYIICTEMIIETIEYIIYEDPNSIIIIQSDHSVRYPYYMWDYYGREVTWSWEDEAHYMSSILNAVYFQGKEFDIEGLSGANTIIRIFNAIFNISMPYVNQTPIPDLLD